MAAIQLSGLASGFDWKSFVDQIIGLERTPANRLETEIANNQLKLTALGGVENRLNDLRSAVDALNTDGVFDAQKASVTGTGWTASASTSTPAGTYSFAVTQKATAAALTGAANIGRPIATSSDVSGVTLASFGAATALTAGEFTVNGARVTVDLGESLQTLFDRISTATGGAVTATYDSAADGIKLTSTSSIVLGSATDTANFLAVARLNNGSAPTTEITSSMALGTVSSTATLANARLGAAITAVDGGGAGSFSVNGVAISYNVNTDNLANIIKRINAAGAGVTAAFDTASDRITLTNTSTGNTGIAVSEASGGLMDALGLTGGAVLARGKNAEFRVNGGPVMSSLSNTLTDTAHGITGLSVAAAEEGETENVTISADTGGMRTKIDTFISRFNSLQSYIEEQSKVTTSAKGKVTASTLSANREIQNWTGQLRTSVFQAVPGLSDTLSRLDHLGIDFAGTATTLQVKDAAKLEAALSNRPGEVSALFRQSSTGLMARMDALLDSYIGNFGGAGLLGGQKTSLTTGNTSLTQQIADIDRRLEQRRALLEASFIAMETAQSTIKNMQTQLTNAFPTNSSK
jgi:flagellar hook-associated protein 2